MEEHVLILGSKGMLGGQLLKVFGAKAIGWDREDCDVLKTEDLRFKIKDLRLPIKAVINCVAYNDVDGAEEKQEIANLLNAEVPGVLAKICKDLGIPLVHFSTNYVFDDEKGEYAEDAQASPKSEYAKSKYEGELAVKNNTDKFYIVRTAVLFGPKGESELSKKSFVELMLDLSSKNPTVKAVSDEVNSITYAPDLAAAVKNLLDDKKPFGVYHITNSGFGSWFDFAAEIFKITGKTTKLEPVPSTDFKRAAHRPKKSVLLNTKLQPLRLWQEALAEFLNFTKY
ncbi:MAG: dTDP-4-dehydrorhamnose reductase [Candidatus Doudnabacteria bacterium]|nr:dTDP-4-dehydrorhamnose reductase [Candidatus Doudnabacteria bacterium]